jgi:predicted amidohydrolase
MEGSLIIRARLILLVFLSVGRVFAAAAEENMPSGAAESLTGITSTLRLGLLRAVPVKWDLEANFTVFLQLLEQAEKLRVDVFITPECWLDGYAAPDPDSTPERLRTVGQDLETSPYLQRVSKEAGERGLLICFGFSSIEEGHLFNTAGLWDRKGKRIGVYHKTHLQTHDLQYSFGEALPVFASEYGPLGILICADRRWPESARVLRLQGARLILNPTYGMCGEANEMWMRTRACENQCYIAFTHPKVSLVVNPEGKVAAKSEEPGPAVLVCDIDLSEATDDNHLRDRRPELYKILAEPQDSLPLFIRP